MRINDSIPDDEIIRLLSDSPPKAWEAFIRKYADTIFTQITRMGFNYDDAMDRFLYVCQKLCEDNFRRLRTIRYSIPSEGLSPWIGKVTKHLCINWAWSEEGRKRLLKPITKLSLLDQNIFKLYFWKGIYPSEICQELKVTERPDIELGDIFDALERILSHLSRKKLSRLLSNLARMRKMASLDGMKKDGDIPFEPINHRPDPEMHLMQKEQEERLRRALDGLPARYYLMVQLRYEQGMAVHSIAEMLHMAESEVKGCIKAAIEKVKNSLK